MRHTKLISQEEAKVSKCQHKSPCSDCPWSRKSLKGWLGSYTVEQWIALAHSDRKIECHTLKNSNGQFHQCAGSAIYRANVCKISKDDTVLRLNQDEKRVFSFNEFEKHHSKKEL